MHRNVNSHSPENNSFKQITKHKILTKYDSLHTLCLKPDVNRNIKDKFIQLAIESYPKPDNSHNTGTSSDANFTQKQHEGTNAVDDCHTEHVFSDYFKCLRIEGKIMCATLISIILNMFITTKVQYKCGTWWRWFKYTAILCVLSNQKQKSDILYYSWTIYYLSCYRTEVHSPHSWNKQT